VTSTAATGAARADAARGSTIVLLTLASGQFLRALDSSVMNVSIATVADDENAEAHIDALRAALAVLALLTLVASVAVFATKKLPTEPPGASAAAG
jgi:predicted transcriptional regulator